MKQQKHSDTDVARLNTVIEQSRCILPWWFDFCCNILNQGWMSDKQRMKLQSFNYETAINLMYGVGGRRRTTKRSAWSKGLDHDDMDEYTGEPCFAEFFS